MELFFTAVKLFGGLALFLYGMSVMGNGLERFSGGKMERTLEKLTSNIFMSVLLGTLVTAAIQSSSATTVIAIGLVNAGILKLRQAIGVIMGANIGTTITAQIIRLSDIESSDFFLQILKPTTLAPFVATIGLVLYMISKKSRTKNMGLICLGFGVLFSGLFAMEGAVSVYKDNEIFKSVLLSLSNPVLGVLAGTIITVIIQSSSASIGILQAVSSTGALPFSACFPIIMGQNIGTCITPILASIGANKNAKRAAMIHLYFNVIGTTVFLIALYSLHYTIGFDNVVEAVGLGWIFEGTTWDTAVSKTTIANFHTLFNIVVTVLFIPFAFCLEKLANLTIRDKKSDTEDTVLVDTMILDDRLLVSPSLAIEHSVSVAQKMASYAKKNFNQTIKLIDQHDPKRVTRIKENEDIMDSIEDRMTKYLIGITSNELTDKENKTVTVLLHLTSEFERIGDYTVNIIQNFEELVDKNQAFSTSAKKELKILSSAVLEIIDHAVECFEKNDINIVHMIEPLEETIDSMQKLLKERHIDRLKQNKCSIESGIIFLDVLSNIERISDHCSNIAIYILNYLSPSEHFEHHKYIKELHQGNEPFYVGKIDEYKEKYFVPLSGE